MRVLLLLLLLLPALAACGEPTNANATKPETVVLRWHLADSDRETIRAARLADVRTATFTFEETFGTARKRPVKLAIALESATVTFEEGGKQIEHRAPVKVTATAIDADGFTLSSGTCRGPHYNMELPPGRDMLLHCSVNATKPNHELVVTFYAYGDGRVDDGQPKRVKVYP